MSFLFGGRPQLSSEQKIAAAEAEIDMVSDMYSRYALKLSLTMQSFRATLLPPISIPIPSQPPHRRHTSATMHVYNCLSALTNVTTVFSSPAPRNASTQRTARLI